MTEILHACSQHMQLHVGVSLMRALTLLAHWSSETLLLSSVMDNLIGGQ